MKSFKKFLAAILTVAMVLNVNVFTASASDSIKVNNVYTNFQKATMATGTTKQIKTTTEPLNATNQGMRFASSDRSVATVSSTGLITAVAPGSAVITVTAKSNSKAKENIAVNVLTNLVIDKSMVDSDNEVLALDGVYGNVYVENTVGDAQIYLSEIAIKNKLVLEKGDYKVFLYDSSAEAVEVKESLDDIVSLATTSTPVTDIPGLYVLSNSSVNNVNSGLGLNLSQDGTSEVRTLTFNLSGADNYDLNLEGFVGNLVINMTGSGNINLGTQGCNIPNVTVVGSTGSGTVQMNNTSASTIGNMIVGGSANVNLQVPTTNLNIGANSSGATVNVNAAVASLNNNGANTNISVGAEVGTLNSTGSGAVVSVLEGGAVTENASNTPVVDVKTTGTYVLVPGFNTNAPGAAPATLTVGDVILNNDFEDGNVSIVKLNTPTFLIANTGNNSNKSLFTTNRVEAWYVPAISLPNYTPSLAGKHVTVRVTADVMYDEGSDATRGFKTTVNGSYAPVASVTANKGEWATMTGTYTVTDTYFVIIFENDSGKGSFYLDNVKVEIAGLADRVFVSGVSVAPATATLGIGQKQMLTATVTPANADKTDVTWMSSNPAVATVKSTGEVTAVSGGTATIYAITADGGKKATSTITVDPTIRIFGIKIDKPNKTFTTLNDTTQLAATVTLNTAPFNGTVTWSTSDANVATVSSTGLVTGVGNGLATITATSVNEGQTKTDTFLVTVDTKLLLLNDYEDKALNSSSDGWMGWAAPDVAVVEESDVENNRVLRINPKNWNTGVIFNVTLPAGKTLADYSGIQVKASWRAGDITWKTLVAEANTTLSGGFDSNAANKIGSISNGTGSASTGWTTYVIPLSGSVHGDLSGTFQIAVGINCDKSKNGVDTSYYIDDIALVKKVPKAITGVTLNKTSTTINAGADETLTATIAPADHSTPGTITWTSSNTAVANVDSTGKVTAVTVGTATITATTATDAVTTTTFTATCDVTVAPAAAKPADPVVEDFEGMAVGTTLTWLGYGSGDGVATVIVDPNDPSNQLLEVKPAGYNRAPIINLAIPAGNTLYDYSTVSYKALWKSGDVGWKDVFVEAGATLTGTIGNNANLIATYYKNAGPTTVLENKDLAISGSQNSLAGNIQISIGISCAATGDSADTVYYLDDITLTPKTPKPLTPAETLIFSADFETTANPFTAAFDAVTADAAVHNWGTMSVVTGSAIGYNNSDGYFSYAAATGEDYRGVGFYFKNAGTYRITAWIKNATNATGIVRLLTLPGYGQAGSNLTINGTTWTKMDFTFTVTAGLSVLIAPQWKDAGGATPAYSYFIDDINVYKEP